MSLSAEGLEERLREHPECIEIEILGESYDFLLTMYGVERANQQGVEVVPKLVSLSNRIGGIWLDDEAEDLEIGSDEMEDRLQRVFKNDDARTLSMVVWWGLLTFQPDLKLETVERVLTPGTLVDVVPKVFNKAMSFAEDQTEEDEEFGGDEEGKSQGSPSTESASEKDTAPGSTAG